MDSARGVLNVACRNELDLGVSLNSPGPFATPGGWANPMCGRLSTVVSQTSYIAQVLSETKLAKGQLDLGMAQQ